MSAPTWRCSWPTGCRRCSPPIAWTMSIATSSGRSFRCWRPWSGPACASTARRWRRNRSTSSGARASARPDLRAGGRIVQHQLAAAAVEDPVRQAAAARAQAQRQDANRVDRRRGARGAGAGARSAAAHPRMAGAAEAERHLHRRAAAARQPGDRPRAHLLQPGGRRDRPVEQQRSEPAEHPDPDRARPRDSPRVHRRSRARADLGRLLADRVSRARAPVRGRRSLIDAFRQGTTSTTQTALKIFGADSGRDPHELRSTAKMVNYALLYGKTAFTLAKDIGVTPAGGAGVHRRLLRRLPARPRVHRSHARGGARRPAW